MHIVALEPFFGGSHKKWLIGLKQNLDAEVQLLTLKANYWKWRMHGGAVSLANAFLKEPVAADLFLASDMLDLTTFQALTRKHTAHIPFALYFHENQLTYPWSETDRDIEQGRDRHYGFINYSSALAADAVFFNSEFHRQSFLSELERFLRFYPDKRELATVEEISDKSGVLPIALPLSAFDEHREAGARIKREYQGTPIIVWNHRWEYDKGPEEFFSLLFRLKREAIPFRLVVMGEQFGEAPEIFQEARKQLAQEIIHWGFAAHFSEYAELLWAADILPVTSRQEFFGISVVEALYCETVPLLPNRLSYPEVCSGLEDALYEPGAEHDKLRSLLNSKDLNVEKAAARTQAGRYDWEKLASRYQELFRELAAS